MDCEHLECIPVYTFKGKIVIDRKFQCVKCGTILSESEYQQILRDNCSWCDSGVIDDGYEKYACRHCLLDIVY